MEYYINNKSIKSIIFDFDETLYYSETMQDEYINFIKNSVMDLTGQSEDKVVSLMSEIGFVKDNQSRPRMRNSVVHFGSSIEAWDKYRENHFFIPDASKIISVNNESLAKLKQLFSLSIVSTEMVANIKTKAEKYNIDLSNFKYIYGSTSYETTTEKSTFYKEIISKEEITPKEVVVIGDRFKVDIQPLLDMGGNGILIKTNKDLEQAIKFLLKQKN